ncbi:MAG TPA: DNA-processing protein DprA [Solirubrobacterales bacterium]|nr:DNA-processing protein DprA [Solirubrobacterales bacterium]
MSERRACVGCLRRSWLLSLLGPFLEKTATGKVGRRSPELLRLGNEDLVEVVAPRSGGRFLTEVEARGEGWFAEALRESGCWAICRHDDRYPPGLRDAADAPWALLGRGDRALLESIEPQAAVTVVGSRRATSYGREVARDLARELAAAGLVVVSGLAFGIDACAHRGALDAGGRTIAVLGCGPDTSYPAAHRGLWRSIAETGAVISELPPGSTPWRWSFPARNRVMAALAGMTVVVEAAARSGSLITADLAAELGRDLGAVPGPVTSRASAGPNELLAGGACVVRDAQDVLDAMLGPGAAPVRPTGPPLEEELAVVLAAVEAGAVSADAVAAALGSVGGATAEGDASAPGDQAARRASVALARLELLGYLTATPTGTFTRTLLAAPAPTVA